MCFAEQGADLTVTLDLKTGAPAPRTLWGNRSVSGTNPDLHQALYQVAAN